MSHELRTPLNAILGFSQVLREEMFGEVNEKQKEYLDDILSSGNHLLSLINDVLDLSKVEAGQIELEVAPFSLREALERGVVMVRERASKDGVRLALATEPEVDVVEGDERRIRQVIFNLLSNAVKFTPEGGSVDVSAAKVNGEVRVAVADTGPGPRGRGSRADLRGVPADRDRHRAARGNRPRSRALEALRRAARRPHLGRQRARQGEHVRVHAAGGIGRTMAGERILVVEDNEKNMKLFRDVLDGDRVSNAGGDDGRRAPSRSRPSTRRISCSWTSSFRTSTASRRWRGCAADERTASIPVAGADRAGDARRPRALPRGGLRRLPLEAGRHRRARRRREAALRRGRHDERQRQTDDPRRRRRARERAPARGRPHPARLRRRLGDRRPRRARARRVGERRTSSCSTSSCRAWTATRSARQLRERRGDGRAARDHDHVEHRAREDAGDRGGRGRLHPEALQPPRAAHARQVAAPDQALPRHDQAAGRGAARAQPHARGACAHAGRGARAPRPAATVPLAAARRRDRHVRRRVDPRQPPAAGRDVLRRPPRLDELRRRGRAGGADARARASSTTRSAGS